MCGFVLLQCHRLRIEICLGLSETIGDTNLSFKLSLQNKPFAYFAYLCGARNLRQWSLPHSGGLVNILISCACRATQRRMRCGIAGSCCGHMRRECAWRNPTWWPRSRLVQGPCGRNVEAVRVSQYRFSGHFYTTAHIHKYLYNVGVFWIVAELDKRRLLLHPTV